MSSGSRRQTLDALLDLSDIVVMTEVCDSGIFCVGAQLYTTLQQLRVGTGLFKHACRASNFLKTSGTVNMCSVI